MAKLSEMAIEREREIDAIWRKALGTCVLCLGKIEGLNEGLELNQCLGVRDTGEQVPISYITIVAAPEFVLPEGLQYLYQPGWELHYCRFGKSQEGLIVCDLHEWEHRLITAV